MRSTIFNVVVTPTSEVTSTSSRLSNTSSSIVDFPTTALVILDKKPSLVFSNPLSSASRASGVSCFFLKKSNKPMNYCLKYKFKYTQILPYYKSPFGEIPKRLSVFLKKNFKKGIFFMLIWKLPQQHLLRCRCVPYFL